MDLTTAEVYVAAVLAKDENLMNVFREGGNFHSQIAKLVFDLPGTVEEVTEVIEVEPSETNEKKWANNRCNYTPQQELGIMIDFPNLSIEEMREKYQRDYRALAGRYEDIWDSEEPSRIALVMEASRIVAARQREEAETATEPRMGWFERRKMRRVARKAAKIQKRLDKMATKYGAILTKGDE